MSTAAINMFPICNGISSIVHTGMHISSILTYAFRPDHTNAPLSLENVAMLYFIFMEKSYISTLDINTLSNGIRWIVSSSNSCNNSYLICPYGTGTIVPCRSWNYGHKVASISNRRWVNLHWIRARYSFFQMTWGVRPLQSLENMSSAAALFHFPFTLSSIHCNVIPDIAGCMQRTEMKAWSYWVDRSM